jgi:cytochrome c
MLRALFAAVLLMAVAAAATAQDKAGRATADEAVAMVKKAVADIKDNGAEKAHRDFGDKQGPFVDRDLYVVVYGLDGKVLAHGANPKLIGKDLMDAQDVDGVYYVRERVENAKNNQSFVDPVTKKIEPKKMYCERLDETAVCGGIYKS